MARKENIAFISCDGKTKVHVVRWLPEDREPCAVLQITHGMREFIERYEPFAEYLCGKGFLVTGHDHLGHGRSVVSQEEWGFFYEKHPSDALVADMHHLRVGTQKEYPRLPYFMLGHSMGSYMLRKYLSRYHKNLSGAIIMGTGYVPVAATAVAKLVTRTLALFKGWHHRSKLISGMTFGRAYRKFDNAGSNPANSWLTKDEEIVKRYYALPECSFLFTLNGFLGLFEAVSNSCNPRNAARFPKDLPLYLISGADDPVGDAGKGVRKVYRMYKKAGIEDVTLKLYENDRHEILNELDREMVYEDIFEWLRSHI